MNCINFVTLNTLEDHAIDLNVDKIVFIEDLGKDGSRIYSNGASILVKEDRDAIHKRIRSLVMMSIC